MRLLRPLFLRHTSIPGSDSGVMAPSHMVKQAGLFDTQMRSLQDIEMWMCLVVWGDYACIDTLLTVIVKYQSSTSNNLNAIQQAAVKVIRRNCELLPRKDQGCFWQAASGTIMKITGDNGDLTRLAVSLKYACSRSLLRHVLGRFLQQATADAVFNYDTYGKPALDGINFSLSHCGDWLALAISHGRRIGHGHAPDFLRDLGA